jgi:HAT1-interacting factor 1
MLTSTTEQLIPTIAEDAASQSSQLQEFLASAAKAYSLKDYASAADLYAQASEIEASINSETSTENADTLYLYGRSLYQVGVSKSDVLGGKASDDNSKAKKQQPGTNGSGSATGEERVAAEVVQKVVENKNGVESTKEGTASGSAVNPLFQITGDENWDDSDEDGDDGEDAASPTANGDAGVEGEGEEEEDDLTAAWNILDLVRVLYTRKLAEVTSQDPSGDSKGKDKVSDSLEDAPHIRHIKERLSDTHDLLAEISLEGEKFPAAVVDFRASLALKKELYPEASSLIAEAHYKLSLALEFAASTTSPDAQLPALADGGAEMSTEEQEAAAARAAHVDEAGREEAAVEMEAAIRSCRLRVVKEEASLSSSETSEADKKNIRDSVADVKEMIKDMEQRVWTPLPPAIVLR